MERTEHYNYAFLDEGSKREIRRCILKAIAIPGYQVPFGNWWHSAHAFLNWSI